MSLRLGLLLFLLLPVAFAAVQPVDLTFAVPIVAIIVVIFLAASNMLAHTISDPRMEAWAKTELREFVAALILIAIITAAFVSSTGVSVALTGTNNYITASTGVLDAWIGKYDSAFGLVIRAASKIRAAATYSPYINVPLWYVSISYSTNPLAGIAILLGTLNLAAQALTNAIFLAEGLRLVIVFLQVVVPKILLPLSFILRLIPFSRKLGNTMIALSIAGIVFLPFSVLLADALNSTIDPINPDMDVSKLDANPWAMVVAEPLCESVVVRTILGLTDPLFALVVCLPLIFVPIVGAALFAACYNVVFYVVYPIINVVFQAVMTALLISWELKISLESCGYPCDVFDTLQPFLAAVNNLVLLTYLDFILIATVTVVGARSLSTALGGEWYMAGIQRLI